MVLTGWSAFWISLFGAIIVLALINHLDNRYKFKKLAEIIDKMMASPDVPNEIKTRILNAVREAASDKEEDD